MTNRRLVLIVHNVRSAHNTGSLLRTADGLGVEEVYLTGYTPYPKAPKDDRPPHIARKVSTAVAKTALGAEKTVKWCHCSQVEEVLARVVSDGFLIAALEQSDQALDISKFESIADIALVVGNEVEGIDKNTLKNIRYHLFIPMLGSKESFNVSVAGALALYHLRWQLGTQDT